MIIIRDCSTSSDLYAETDTITCKTLPMKICLQNNTIGWFTINMTLHGSLCHVASF